LSAVKGGLMSHPSRSIVALSKIARSGPERKFDACDLVHRGVDDRGS
jgi:hypothetical protein